MCVVDGMDEESEYECTIVEDAHTEVEDDDEVMFVIIELHYATGL